MPTKNLKIAGLVFSAVFVLATEAFASGPFRIINRNCSTSGNPSACNALFNEVEKEVNKDLPDADASTYLKGMANASVMSAKGVGTDYANDIDLFIFGVGVGIGADVGSNSFSDLVGGDVDNNQVRGVSFAPSIMFGLNLGVFDMPKWSFLDLNKVKLMGNFFTMKLDSFDDDLDGKVTNFGIHARYRIIDPVDIVPGRMVRWNGVDITTGFEYNSLDLRYLSRFDDQEIEVDGQTATIDGTVRVGADVSSASIPVVASTGVQLGYILTTYGGLGVDLNLGSSKSLASLDADIDAGGFEGDGVLDLGQKDSPSALTGRAFFGLQLNLSVVKLYAQLDKGFSSGLYAANAGLRLTW